MLGRTWQARGLVACLLLMLVPSTGLAQRAVGELHLQVVDGSGAPVVASGTIEGTATQVRRTFTTPDGKATLAALPFGEYRVTVARDGFAPVVENVTLGSAIPVDRVIRLSVASLQATVSVTAATDQTLANPTRTGSTRYVGPQLLSERQSAAPGRSLIDLVNLQPGWVLEANGILHARGSEYQVQYVIDGIPLRDNRSPAFAQSLGVEEFESIAIRTGGYPAEFGNKLGGVIEVNTARDTRRGLHGSGSFQGGSFATAAGHGALQFGTETLRAGITAEGSTTDRYLDPPTEDNFNNTGRSRGVAGRVERAWSDSTRTRFYGYGHDTRFTVPNERVQEEAGQRQDRTASEWLGQAAHQQMLSPRTLLNVGFMMRDVEATLASNPQSIPIVASQDRSFTERYVNASVTSQRGIHELRAGGEVAVASISEAFASTITAREIGDGEVFDDDVPDEFAFAGEGTRREQALFVQDVMRFGDVTLSAGLRFDHHRLFEDEHAWSPRLSGSWAVRPALVLHAAYDRTFETQPIENILLASTDLEGGLGDEAVTRPLRSSRGHAVEGGASWTIGGGSRLEATVFRRYATDVTDDDLLLNTAVSFPITFASATVQGLELALETGSRRGVSGGVSYSLSSGTGRLPLTGGLFLDVDDDAFGGDEAFTLSQDQRHTLRTRIRAALGSTGWIAGMVRFDSGLPVEIEGDDTPDADTLSLQFGEAIVDRVDFERGRVHASSAVDLSAGATLFQRNGSRVGVQVDAFNIFNRLNVINFAGLLSGTAVAAPRSFAARLELEF